MLAACASTKEVYIDRPVEDLYNGAMDDLNDGSYQKAAKTFDEVDRQHPYSVWATKAQLMSAYSLYQQGRYDDSIIAADRFIQLHPGHRDIAYAYYLKALDYYIQIADVARDQKTTEQALNALSEVVRRFPDSKYARDARLKMDLARDHLGGKEMDIGRWYERQGEFLQEDILGDAAFAANKNEQRFLRAVFHRHAPGFVVRVELCGSHQSHAGKEPFERYERHSITIPTVGLCLLDTRKIRESCAAGQN